MDIQKLSLLKNSYVDSLLKQNKVDEQLALEIIDLHLQPQPVIYAIYKKSLEDYKKEPNSKNDFLMSVTEEILSDGLYVSYPEPHSFVKDQINTTALSIKYSDLSSDQFKIELKILNAKKDNDPYINNHHRYNYYAGLYAYKNKFGVFLDDNAFDSFYRAEPTFSNIKNYLANYLENYAINTYSSEEIEKMLEDNKEESRTNNEFRAYNQEKIDLGTARLHDLELSKKAIQNLDSHDQYLEVEKTAYSNALRFKKSIENDLPLIAKLNNHTINKVIEDMQKNKEMKASHLTMIKDLYSGETDPNVTLQLYREAYEKDNSTYYRNGIRLINAIINDKNVLSSDPNVNPYLIIHKHAIEKASNYTLSNMSADFLHETFEIPAQYEHLRSVIGGMVSDEINNRYGKSLTDTIIKNMSENDITNFINSSKDSFISKIKNSDAATPEDYKDIIKACFSNNDQMKALAIKYYDLAKNSENLTNFELVKNDRMVDFLKNVHDNSDKKEKNMEEILSSYIKNNDDDKVKKLLDDVKSVKGENTLVEKTTVLIDRLSLEKDTSFDNNIINRIRRKFK